jgi:hypothetical protein
MEQNEVVQYVDSVKKEILDELYKYIAFNNLQMQKCQEAVITLNDGLLMVEKTVAKGISSLQEKVSTFEARIITAMIRSGVEKNILQ